MRTAPWLLAFVCLLGCSEEDPVDPEPPTPKEPVAPEALLPSSCGHAHNDYEHDRPLLDAVELGFCSVEVDIFLEGDQLLVAHTALTLDPERSLQSLYLDPLRALSEAGDLPAPATGKSLILLIDVKTEAVETYAALDPILDSYDDILTRFEDGQVLAGPVTALISGNRDEETIAAQSPRHAALDGRPDDLDKGIALDVMPLISSSWNLYFDWDGTGEMPTDERTFLDGLIETAHGENRRFRFWASPDVEAAWQTLLDAESDLVNTDDLAGFASFHGGS